jgi:hypothetical protein
MDLTELTNKFKNIEIESKKINDKLINIETNIKWNHPNYNFFQGTYLESKSTIIELYKLFIFYGMLEYYFDHQIVAGDSFV